MNSNWHFVILFYVCYIGWIIVLKFSCKIVQGNMNIFSVCIFHLLFLKPKVCLPVNQGFGAYKENFIVHSSFYQFSERDIFIRYAI